MTTDLTIGNPKKVLLAFTVPMLISVTVSYTHLTLPTIRLV